MVMIKRKKHKTTTIGSKIEACKASVKFLDKCRELEASSSVGKVGMFLVTKYKELFGRSCPDGMLCLTKAKISYKLEYDGYKKEKITMSSKFMKNYDAAMAMDYFAFDNDMKILMEIRVNQEKEGGVDMAKVKRKQAKLEAKEDKKEAREEKKASKRIAKEEKKAAKKEKKTTKKEGKIGTPREGSVRGLFWKAFAAGKSDDKALAAVLKALPKKKYDLSAVSRFRRFYVKHNG